MINVQIFETFATGSSAVCRRAPERQRQTFTLFCLRSEYGNHDYLCFLIQSRFPESISSFGSLRFEVLQLSNFSDFLQLHRERKSAVLHNTLIKRVEFQILGDWDNIPIYCCNSDKVSLR